MQSLFILQQRSLSAVLTCPLFYISDINLVCSVVFVFLTITVVAHIVCSQHTENLLWVNFLHLHIDLECVLKGVSHSAHVGLRVLQKSGPL